jgi:2-aminoethylphosphonate-pyruvate transaminase
MPADPAFDFQTFYDRVKERGYILYPGKLTVAPSFRVGCIGHLQPIDMQAAVDAMKAVLVEMGVASGKPA